MSGPAEPHPGYTPKLYINGVWTRCPVKVYLNGAWVIRALRNIT